jgi:hypothetical protein
MRRRWFALIMVALATAPLSSGHAGAQVQNPSQPVQNAPLHHDSAQSVTPSFEGWYRNPDGTISLSFGYMNRNYVEQLDIPIGPDNRIEPGPPDQGQPTHFMPRRNTGVFTIVVPNDKPTSERTWTVTAHGETVSIPSNLRPEWGIDALKEITNGNTPPVLKFDPAGKPAQGPGGITSQMSVTLPSAAALNVWVTDDGIRKRQGDTDNLDDAAVRASRSANAPPRPPALGVAWSKYRGPGRVVFGEATPKIVDGRATTSVTFAEPGEYVLRVLAWDDSGPQAFVMAGGFQCCWTNAYVKVSARSPHH